MLDIIGTNTYLIGRGHQRILIDTGEGKPSWANHLKGVLARENATVHKALLTHWHHDHVNGVPDLHKICPHATVYKHQPDEGQLDIEDGQVFSVEGATLKAYHTPGHTVDHMMFVLEEEDAIITGDSESYSPLGSCSMWSPLRLTFFLYFFFVDVLGHGTAVFEDLPVYLSSLQRMQNRVSGRGYPGHGAVIENATTKITEYINHRQQREEEVIRVLRYGKLDVADNEPSPERKASWTPIELVKVIYQNVPKSLHLPASHGVLQVLMKLEAEGKVVHDAETGKWRIDNGKSAL
jgi:glyoxylase-like metal-dependent hydrolase (beta-lactamase superfamily II)